jgi:hypothetical protein
MKSFPLFSLLQDFDLSFSSPPPQVFGVLDDTMAARPPNRPLPQVRGTPANRAAMASQLTQLGKSSTTFMDRDLLLSRHQILILTAQGSIPSGPRSLATSTPGQSQSQIDVAASQSQILHTINNQPHGTNRPQTFDYSMTDDLPTSAAELAAHIAQMEYMLSNMARLSPDPERTMQMAALSLKLATAQARLDPSSNPPRLSGAAPEFTPSPVPRIVFPAGDGHRSSESQSQNNIIESGDMPFSNTSQYANASGALSANPLNQQPLDSLPTFAFSNESGALSPTYSSSWSTQAQAQLAAVYGSSAAVPAQNAFSGINSAHTSINPVTGRTRTSLAHLRAISDSALRRRAAAQAQADLAQSNLAQSNFAQSNFAQSNLAQSNIAQSNLPQSNFAQTNFAQSNLADQPQAQSQGQVQEHWAQNHNNHGHLQSQAQSLDHNQQNQQYAAQQSQQQQYPYGMNDMSFIPHAHSQQPSFDFDFAMMQAFNNRASHGYAQQNYCNNSSSNVYDQGDQQSFNPYGMVPTMSHSPERVNRTNNLPLMPPPGFGHVPMGNNSISQPPTAAVSKDITEQAQANQPKAAQAQAESAQDKLCGYFPSNYELCGKWSTLHPSQRTPPEILRQKNIANNNGEQSSDDAVHAPRDGPGGGPSSVNREVAPGNGANDNGGASLNRGMTNNRGDQKGGVGVALVRSQPAQARANTGRPGAGNKWKSATHALQHDYAALQRNAGHLDLVNSPAFPQTASEYVGIRADSIASKQARLKLALEDLTRPRSDYEVVKPAMGGKMFDGPHSTVLAGTTSTWVHPKSDWPPKSWPTTPKFPSVAETKNVHAIHLTASGRPSRFFPTPKMSGDSLDGRPNHDAMAVLQTITGTNTDGSMLEIAELQSLNLIGQEEIDTLFPRPQPREVLFLKGEGWAGVNSLGEMPHEYQARVAHEAAAAAALAAVEKADEIRILKEEEALLIGKELLAGLMK